MSKQPDYSTHEALHMCSFLAHSIEQELIEHDAIKASANWLALAEAASKALHDLYQSIGEAHLVDNDTSEEPLKPLDVTRQQLGQALTKLKAQCSGEPSPTGKLSDRAPFDGAAADETVRDKAALAWLALEEGKEPKGKEPSSPKPSSPKPSSPSRAARKRAKDEAAFDALLDRGALEPQALAKGSR